MGKANLCDLAEGSIIRVMDGGAATEYVLAKHNYEAGLNGPGNTLFVRYRPVEQARAWGGSTPEDANWRDDSTLRVYLETEYINRYPNELRKRIKPVSIYVSTRPGTDVMNGATVFVLSYPEVYVKSFNTDGDTLPEPARKLIMESKDSSGHPYYSWLRTTQYDEEEHEDHIDHYVYAYARYDTYQPGTKSPNAECYFNPCFAMETAGLAIGDDGLLRENHPPVITGDCFDSESAHVKRAGFSLLYTVTDEDNDAVTVTEYLDDEVLRTYVAVNGESNKLTITSETLNGLDKTVHHELRIVASDGFETVSKIYRFHGASGAGYVVYIGRIAGIADGTGYYWTERKVLHNAGDETAPIVLDPEVTLEASEFGSFTFTIPAFNPHYKDIAMKATVISVEEDGNEIFMGYVTEMNKTFNLDMEVTCEGELGYLQDRDCVIEDRAYTPTELITLAVTADGRFAQEGKSFHVGSVTAQKTGTDKDEKETRTVTDCWSAAKSYLQEKYGGYLRLRKIIKMENGVRVYRRYLDYLADIPDKTGQTIRFGENLLDVSYYLKANEIVNSLIVIGYETTGWFFFTDTKEIRVTVNNDASIEEFGLCQRIMTVDGTDSTRESLLQKGKEELEKYTSQFSGSITVNAADLADVGVDVDRLEFLKQTGVISEAHGLKNWLLCTKEVIPLDAPEEKTFTFGATSQNLSALQASNFGTAGKAWDMIQSTIKYVKSGG